MMKIWMCMLTSLLVISLGMTYATAETIEEIELEMTDNTSEVLLESDDIPIDIDLPNDSNYLDLNDVGEIILDSSLDVDEPTVPSSNDAVIPPDEPFPGAVLASTLSYEPDTNGSIVMPRPYAYNLKASGSGTYLTFSYTAGAEFGFGPYTINCKVYKDGELISSSDSIDISGKSYSLTRTITANEFMPGLYTVYVAVEDSNGSYVYTSMSKKLVWNSDGSKEILGNDASAPLYPDFHVAGGTTLVGYSGNERNVVIPTGLVSTIGTSAFSGCSNMLSLTIPNSVTNIENNIFGSSSMPELFSDCDELVDIYLDDAIANIAPNAFSVSMRTIFDSPITIHTKCNSITHKALLDNGFPYGLYQLDIYNHTEVIDPRIEPTCTQAGLSQGKHCSVCSSVIVAQHVIPEKGHTPVTDPAVTPTCTKNGLTEGSHCTVCNAIIKAQEVVPVADHTPVTDPSVTPTCTETGLTEGSHCSACGKVIKAQQTVPAKGHITETDKAIAPTCTKTGLTEGSHCSVCKAIIKAQETIPATGHTPVTDPAVAPTIKKTGLTEGSHCSVCGEILLKQQTVPKLISVKKCKITGIEDAVYTGKAIQPAPVVKYNGKKLVKGVDYTVKYAKNKAIGAATVTVTGIGKYGESVSKTFNINPRAVALSKLTAGKQQLTVKWKKGAGITGYEVQYGLKKSFAGAKTVAVKKTAVKTVLKKLTAGKTYYVRIRAYKTVKGKKYYSAWSKAKGAKVK